MREKQLYELMDLIEEIKKTDAMLKLHSGLDDSDFMSSQYHALKDNLIGNLIDYLVSPELRTSRTYFTIKLLLEKFYPELSKESGNSHNNSADLSALEAKILQF